MTSEEWERVAEIYSDVLDLPPRERLAYISSRCDGNERLEAQLKQMLKAEEIEQGFLDRPVSLVEQILPEIAVVPRLAMGDVLSERFEIIRFLARGGMGEVYEAYDRVLHEPAAIKTIRSEIADHPGIAELFKQEVSRARAIRSDQVCPVFDVFEDNSFHEPLLFFSMKLLEGETLSQRLRRCGPLPVDLAIPVIIDVAAGIAAAHREQLVHGDLKSGNVMLVRSRTGALRATVTDFGLAQQIVSEPGGAGRERGQVRLGIGTPAYMAPEQRNGSPATSLSDIYSFGVVAYEALSGSLPAAAEKDDSAAKRQDSRVIWHLSGIPRNIPKTYERAIRKCLSARPEDRYASAEALLEALSGPKRRGVRSFSLALLSAMIAGWAAWHSGITNAPHRVHAPHNSVAVMPFTTPDGRNRDYFGDGFTEELARNLSKSSDLRVVGSDSTLTFRGADLSPRECGERLNVEYLVFGTVRRENMSVAVSARLVRASDGVQLWSEKYTRTDAQLASIQTQIANEIAGTLQTSLAGIQSELPRFASTLQIQDLYWMGRHHWRQRTNASLRTSAIYFEQCSVRDPGFAPGWSGLADAYTVMAERELVPPAEGLRKAEYAARRAVALDPRLPEAWVSLGQVQSVYNRDFTAAEQSFRHAIELQPQLSSAHQWYSYMLTKQRRFAEAIDHGQRAINAEPLSVPANVNLAAVLYYAQHNDEAIIQSRKVAQLDPRSLSARLIVGQVMARRGEIEAAIREMEQIPEASQSHPLTIRFWAELYAIAGRRQAAEEAIARLVEMRPQGLVPAFYIASAWATLGEKDRAFEWLDRACSEMDGIVSMVDAAPGFDGLRSDPRYQRVLRKLGLTAGISGN